MSATSVLERFLIYFSADTVALEHGTKKAKKDVDSLEHGLKASDHIAQKLGGSFKDTIASLGGALVAFLSLEKIASGIKNAEEYAESLGKLAHATGENIEQLSAWSDAVKQSGGNAEEFQETIRRLSAQFAQAAATGHSRLTPFFKQLGISMTDSKGHIRSVLDVLPELAASFQKIGAKEAFGIGSRLGLDKNTILLLEKGKVGVEEILKKQRELGVVTEEDYKRSEEFKESWLETEHAFRTVGLSIGSIVLPILTEVIETFERFALFAKTHAHLVTGALIALGTALTVYVIPPLTTMAIEAAIAFAPFFLIGAVIAGVATAFALLYEDVMNYLDGNKSLIGQIFDKYPTIKNIVLDLVEVFLFFNNIATSLLRLLVDLFTNPAQAWSDFEQNMQAGIDRLVAKFPILGAVIAGFGEVFTATGYAIKAVWGGIVAAIAAVVRGIEVAIAAVEKGYRKTKSFLGIESESASTAGANSTLHGATTSTLAAPGSSSTNVGGAKINRTTSVRTGDIHVQTQATDAKGISQAIGDSLKSQMRQALNAHDDGLAI